MILNDNTTQQINTLVIQLQNRITNLNNESKSLNKEIDDLDSKISDLEKRVGSNANANANDIAAMNAEIKANTKAISGNADKSHTHTKSEITDFPTSLPANGGNATKASLLDEYVGAGGTRPTSGNIRPKDATEYGGMRKDVVTSSMTDSGHPGQDGHLLTMFWDNSGRHDSQFFISNEKQPLTVKVRAKDNEADYGPWVDLITSQNISSQTVAKASTAGTADVANALVNRGGITNTDTFQKVMNNDGKWSITDLDQGWNGSLYSFHVGGSQSGLMFRIRGGSGDIRNVEVNYSVDSNRFASSWTPLIGRIPTSSPSSPKDGDIWIE